MLAPATGERAQAAAARAPLARAGARAGGPAVPEIGLVTVVPPPGTTPAGLAARLRADPAVRSAVPEGRMRLRLFPGDPALTAPEGTPGTPEGTPLQWAPARQGLFRAWDFHRGDGVLVAVIDSGVDAAHPELAGKIAGTADHDLDSSRGPPTVDEDGHGTHVSSLACAAGGNGIGLAGAGLHCRLLVLKTDLSDASVADAVVDAANRGAHAINMSFGDDGSRPTVPALAAAVDHAVRRNVVLVAAASDGPTGEQGQPANLLQPTGTAPALTQGRGLSVTSAAFDDGPSGAGAGTQVSLAAYGSFARFGTSSGPRGLLGAYPGTATRSEAQAPCSCRTSLDGDNRYAYIAGTSMAAPQVAAVAALVRRRNPDLSALDVVRVVKQAARRPAGRWTPELGWGILDGGTALDLASRIDRRAPYSRLRTPTVARTRVVTLRWTGARDLAAPGLRPAGILAYELWASLNGRPYRRVYRTVRTVLPFRVLPGARYAFYTIAVDRQGNREARPRLADARTIVLRSAR